MAIINKGTSFANGEQLTAQKINNMLDLAVFNSAAADNSTTFVNSLSQIAVTGGGINTAQLADDAVETPNIKDANVNLPKIATQADQTVLANISGADASPTAVDIVGPSGILIDDDALGTSDTAGATQGNIKAYIDDGFDPPVYTGGETTTLPNGLIMKFGTISAPKDTTTAVNFAVDFPNAVVSAQLTQEHAGNADRYPLKIESLNTGTLTIRNTHGAEVTAHWLVFGR